MKRKHMSLTFKVNILIIVITLTVSLLLVIISAVNYRKAILDPYVRKLAAIEIDADEYSPYLEYFSSFFGTEEMEQARASIDTENDYFIDWLDEQPSFTADDPEYGRESLFLDSLALEFSLVEIMDSFDLDEICAEVQKGHSIYQAVYIDKKKGYSPTALFGQEDTFFDVPPEEFSSPVMVKTSAGAFLFRCVCLDLDGGQGRIWMSYNMTEPMLAQRELILRSILYILILTAAASMISVQLLWRNLTKPIRMLAQAATKFEPEEDGTYSAGKISQVNIRSGNELGDLSREIQSMQVRIVENTENLTRMTAEKERINTELNMATQIQEGMLPNTFPPFPERKEFDLFASMSTAREVGGDFYDFFLIDQNHLALVMADVSGKGVPAALFMMVTKSILKNNTMIGKSVGEILSMTNEIICSNNKMQMFVTVWLGILEISTGKITAANAGHEYPAIMKNSSFELYKDRHSFVLGGLSGLHYKEYEFQLEKGSKLFLYTDGVTEAMNARGELFGTQRMLDALNRAAGDTPKDILAGVQSAVNDFAGNAEQADDLTMLCLEYKG